MWHWWGQCPYDGVFPKTEKIFFFDFLNFDTLPHCQEYWFSTSKTPSIESISYTSQTFFQKTLQIFLDFFFTFINRITNLMEQRDSFCIFTDHRHGYFPRTVLKRNIFVCICDLFEWLCPSFVVVIQDIIGKLKLLYCVIRGEIFCQLELRILGWYIECGEQILDRLVTL